MDQVDFADKAVLALEPLEFPHLATIEQMVQSCETKVSDPPRPFSISRDLSTPTLRYLRNNHEYFLSTCPPAAEP